MNGNENRYLGEEPVGSLMRKYAIPCIISLLVGALYNIVDQIFIANASFLSQISLVAAMAAINNMIRKYGAMDKIFGQEQYAQIPMAVVGIVMKFFQIVISIVFGVGFALLLPLKFGLDGVLYSMPLSDLLTFLMALFLIIQTYRELRMEKIG